MANFLSFIIVSKEETIEVEVLPFNQNDIQSQKSHASFPFLTNTILTTSESITYKVYFKAHQKGLLSAIFQISSKTLRHFKIRCCVLSGLGGAFTLYAICLI